MKSMVWKELRENFKWALLGLLGLVLAEFYSLSIGRDDRDSYNSLTLCGTSFLMVSSFGCAAIGAGLGIIQILPELNRDRWASLFHRPVSREIIFSGKVVAGLVLYLLVTGGALLGSMYYVARPGQFPTPFLPAMALPAASDIVLGVVFYFAALLLCLHRGRWWGSRGVIAFSVLPIFVLHSGRWGMWCLPIVAALVFFGAGLGALLSNGRPQSQSKAARLALVLVLALGSYAVVALVTSVANWISLQKRPLIFNFYSRYEVARDGQIFLSTQRGDGSETTMTDVKGNPVTDERYLGNDRYNNLIQMSYLSFDLKNKGSLQKLYLSTMPRNLRNYLIPISRDPEAKEIWYCLIEENYFVGYDKLSRLCVGICDAEGFKPPGSVAKPFPEPLQTADYFEYGPKFYWVGSQIYKFEFTERSMVPFYNSEGVRIGGAMALADSLTPQKAAQAVVVTEQGILLFDPEGKEVFLTPFIRDPKTEQMVQIATNNQLQRVYVLCMPTYWLSTDEAKQRDPMVLNVLDAKGKLLQSYQNEVPALPLGGFTWLARLTAWSKPLLPAAWYEIYQKASLVPDYNYYTGFGINFSVKVTEKAWMGLVVLHLVLGAGIFFWARHSGFPWGRAVGWAIFTICFGLTGCMTFFLAADWPQRVRCVQCGGMRPVEKETCPHCSKDWPLPVKDGTEILVA